MRSAITHIGTTLKHKALVAGYLLGFSRRLLWRALVHDLSKFWPDEALGFSEMTSLFKRVEYGSPEYNAALQSPCIALHYARNRHHPEHFEKESGHANWMFGIEGMSLIDVVEMYCDWKAATKRYGGDFREALEKNAKRFDLEKNRAPLFGTLFNQEEQDRYRNTTSPLESLFFYLNYVCETEKVAREGAKTRAERPDVKAARGILERYKDYETLTMEDLPELGAALGPYADDMDPEQAEHLRSMVKAAMEVFEDDQRAKKAQDLVRIYCSECGKHIFGAEIHYPHGGDIRHSVNEPFCPVCFPKITKQESP